MCATEENNDLRDRVNQKKEDWITYILIHYRCVFVVFFLLPASFFYDIFFYARSWLVFKLNSAPLKHDRKVSKIQSEVRKWQDGDRAMPMCTSRPGWQTISFRRPKYKETFFKVNVNLVDVLEIDVRKQTVRCEPLVSMGQLTSVLIDHGWTIPVVPEMDDLTVGGLVMGTGIETSSHKHGLFQHICVAFELVLSDGSVANCSKTENSDLFYAVPWSYGTLGFLTAVEIKIIPVQRFAKVDYKPCYTLESLVETFTEEAKKEAGNEFVEALMFSLNTGVVMVANHCTTAEPNKLNEIGVWHKPWFFKHVETFLKKGDQTEYIPIRHYYHRHTRSIFWEIQDIIPFGNNVVFRYLLGWLVPPKVSLLKLTQLKAVKELYENNHFIQDMMVPMTSLKDALQLFHDQVKIYPIWLCPFKLPNNPGFLKPPKDQETLYVDIGTYGVPHVSNFHPVKTTRKVEEFVRRVGGFQMMYADTYMTEDEYRTMFDHTLYDKMRKELRCDKAFPEVYNKISRNARI